MFIAGTNKSPPHLFLHTFLNKTKELLKESYYSRTSKLTKTWYTNLQESICNINTNAILKKKKNLGWN